MAILIDAYNRDDAHQILEGSFALRKRILVDKLRWELPSGSGPLEIDQFDAGDMCHLVSLGRDGNVRGTLRATDSRSPNVTCDVLQAFYTVQIPRAVGIGEVSRLCIDLDLSPIERRAARADLFSSLAELCLERGWSKVVGILRQAMLFDFVRMGLTVDLLAPPVSFGAGIDPAVAFMLETAEADVDRCKAFFGIDKALRTFQPTAVAELHSAA